MNILKLEMGLYFYIKILKKNDKHITIIINTNRHVITFLSQINWKKQISNNKSNSSPFHLSMFHKFKISCRPGAAFLSHGDSCGVGTGLPVFWGYLFLQTFRPAGTVNPCWLVEFIISQNIPSKISNF
jgi:hypothetical protein